VKPRPRPAEDGAWLEEKGGLDGWRRGAGGLDGVIDQSGGDPGTVKPAPAVGSCGHGPTSAHQNHRQEQKVREGPLTGWQHAAFPADKRSENEKKVSSEALAPGRREFSGGDHVLQVVFGRDMVP